MGSCVDYVNVSINTCDKDSITSDGNFKKQSKDRFKCIFAKDGSTCPATHTVQHGGNTYPCSQPAEREENATECKAWCQNLHPVDGCKTLSRDTWSRSGRVKCTFEKDEVEGCKKSFIKHGQWTFPC